MLVLKNNPAAHSATAGSDEEAADQPVTCGGGGEAEPDAEQGVPPRTHPVALLQQTESLKTEGREGREATEQTDHEELTRLDGQTPARGIAERRERTHDQ